MTLLYRNISLSVNQIVLFFIPLNPEMVTVHVPLLREDLPCPNGEDAVPGERCFRAECAEIPRAATENNCGNLLPHLIK